MSETVLARDAFFRIREAEFIEKLYLLFFFNLWLYNSYRTLRQLRKNLSFSLFEKWEKRITLKLIFLSKKITDEFRLIFSSAKLNENKLHCKQTQIIRFYLIRLTLISILFQANIKNFIQDFIIKIFKSDILIR